MSCLSLYLTSCDEASSFRDDVEGRDRVVSEGVQHTHPTDPYRHRQHLSTEAEPLCIRDNEIRTAHEQLEELVELDLDALDMRETVGAELSFRESWLKAEVAE
jgi:hypothetical protein